MFGRKRKAIKSAAPHPYSDLPLVLASGMGRSGTTVLRHCLGAHPGIDCRNRESNYICDLMRVAFDAMQHPNRLENLVIEQAEFWRLHQQLLLNLLWPDVAGDDQPAARAMSTYSMLGPQAAEGVQKAFSRSAIIFIVRNGIEVVSSYLSFGAFSHMSFEKVCKLWALKYDMIEYCASHEGCFEFRYEWLTDHSRVATELTRALAHVGLEFHESCLGPLGRRFHPTAFPGESAAESQDANQRSERWRHWSAEQRQMFEQHCARTMINLGYAIPWTADRSNTAD